MLYKNIFPILLSVMLIYNGQVNAQKSLSQNPVFNSPQGPVLLFGTTALSANGTDAHGTTFSITRTEAGIGNAKTLRLPGMAANFPAFKKTAGASVVQQLQKQLKLKTEDELWAFIKKHPELSDYGLMALSIPFRLAMGAACVDEEVKDRQGKTYEYAISVHGSNQNISRTATITIGSVPEFASPKSVQSKAGDSTVNIKWVSTANRNTPYLAFVYRQAGGRGAFSKIAARILVIHKKDSAYFLFSEKVNTNTAYRYFIRPADLLENEGKLNSDTVNLVTVDYNKLPVITGLRAADTLKGILLTWKTLPANALLTGIEIQRSRDSRGDYVAIDTIPASSGSYLDTKLLPHVAYYYRLCVLHAGQAPKEKYYAKIGLAKQKSSHTPDAPYGLHATTTDQGVRITWKPVDDLDFYAYYVYRGTSLNSSMEIISPSIKDTLFIDTTHNLSRQVNYVYAIKAVSNAGNASDFSEKMAARMIGGKEKPLTPGGIRVVPDNNRLLVQWEDVQKNDPSVLGYILYKHEKGNQPPKYAADKPASEEAARLNLTPVVNGVITVPYYEDAVPVNNKRYEYFVSAIDKYGAESGLSASAASPQYQAGKITPPAAVSVRNVKDGVALQWNQSQPVKSFTVYRRIITEKSFTQVAVIAGNKNTYLDKLPLRNSLYVYMVAATSTGGEIEKSDEKTVRR